MTEQFNPYHAWLDLDQTNHNPTYPELLGVATNETDPTKVHMAFDRVIAQVRSHKPGPHTAEWARLIDELKAAQMAASKMGFAAVVAASKPPAAGQAPAPTAAPPAATTPQPATPQPATAQEATAQEATAQEATAQEVDPILAALGLDDDDGFTPDFTTPDDEVDDTPVAAPAMAIPSSVPAPAAVDQAAVAPAAVDQAAVDQAAVAPAAVTQATLASATLASATLASAPQVPVAGAPVPQPVAAPASDGLEMTAAVAQRGGGYGGLIVGFASCALMVVILGVGYYLWFGPEGEDKEDEDMASNKPVAREVKTSNKDDQQDKNDQQDKDDQQNRNETDDEEKLADDDGNETTPKDGTKPADDDEKMEPTDDAAKPVDPPTVPTAEPKERELTEEELKKLADLLRSAKTALGTQEIAKSKELLAEAKPLAGTTSQRAMIDRLEALTGYVEAFHKAIPQALESMQPGDSFPVSEAIVALVEKKPESVIIHVAGRNREYPLSGLSLGLGLALADQVLDQDAPSTNVVKGAFQAVHPRASEEHIQQVRDWWREAMDAGESLGDLILVVDDDYGRMAGEE